MIREALRDCSLLGSGAFVFAARCLVSFRRGVVQDLRSCEHREQKWKASARFSSAASPSGPHPTSPTSQQKPAQRLGSALCPQTSGLHQTGKVQLQMDFACGFVGFAFAPCDFFVDWCVSCLSACLAFWSRVCDDACCVMWPHLRGQPA